MAAGEPKVLLDEPFGALDPGITTDMHDIVLRLWAANRMTIFMITHDLKEGFQLGTRVLVFDRPRHDPIATCVAPALQEETKAGEVELF